VPDEQEPEPAEATPEAAPRRPSRIDQVTRRKRRLSGQDRREGPQFAPDSPEAAAVSFLTVFNRAFRLTRLYPGTHPTLQGGLDEVHRAYEVMVAALPRVVLGARGGDLLIGNVPVRDVALGIQDLYKLFTELEIESLIIERGAAREVLHGFLRLLASRDPENEPDLPYRDWSEVPCFRVNDIAYSMVAGDEKVVDKSQVGEGAGSARLVDHLAGDLDQLDSDEANELRRLLKTNPGAVAALVRRAVQEAVAREGGTMAQPTIARALENLSGDLAEGEGSVSFSDLRDRLARMLFYLPPEFLRETFGKDLKDLNEQDYAEVFAGFSANLRAKLLENELKRHDSPDALASRLDRMVKGEDELIKITEQISVRLQERGLSYEDAKSEMMAMADAIGHVRRRRLDAADLEVPEEARELFQARATIVALDPDPTLCSQYQTWLAPRGFRVLTFTDGAAALEAVRREQADILLLELKLPGLHGLQIVQALAKEGPEIPVVVVTGHPALAREFELRTYARHRLIEKPATEGPILEAIDEFMPHATRAIIKEHVAERLQSEADLSKARAVQARLLPESIPLIDGYDLGAYYRASREVGGDYYDVIPLGDGSYGLAIADVSGKGVSGAMIMVMMRGVLRMIARWSRSPGETLCRVNKHLNVEMLDGMFVTAAYGVFDPAQAQFTVALAGHNPPLVFRPRQRSGELLQPGGMALGLAKPERFDKLVREQVIPLGVNDRVVLYTDGVVEAMSPDERVFGEDKLLAAVRDASFLQSEDLIAHLLEQVEHHQDTAPQSDDITLLTLKRLR
jgi:sigma-B regulation protein RsbU (phosphoserine phosphatase)